MADCRVIDIETVPDLTVWTPPPAKYSFGAESVRDSRGKLVPEMVKDEPFPPPHAHRVVAISWVDLYSDLDSKLYYGYETSKSLCRWSKGDDADAVEADLLKEFLAAQNKDKATLVTWNGRGFDLPVLGMRCLKQGLPFKFYYEDRDIRYRYSEGGHCDLMDVMGDFGAARNMKLGDIARVIGLPGKTGEVGGGNVADYYAQGDTSELMAKVARYCLSDTIQTAILYARFQFHKGITDANDYNRALDTFAKSKEVAASLTVDWKKVKVAA